MKPWLRKIVQRQLAKRNLKIVTSDFYPARQMQKLDRKHHLDIYAIQYTNDFTRLSLLDLEVDEIKQRNTPGAWRSSAFIRGISRGS